MNTNIPDSMDQLYDLLPPDFQSQIDQAWIEELKGSTDFITALLRRVAAGRAIPDHAKAKAGDLILQLDGMIEQVFHENEDEIRKEWKRSEEDALAHELG
jgi:hypothetical protein